MKKLMIAAAVMIAGVSANAAAVEWMAEGIAPLASGANIDDTKVYAFETSTLSQDAFLALFAAEDTSWLSSAFVAEAYEDGAAMGQVTGYANGAATSNWLAIFDDAGNVLVTDSVIDKIGASGQSATPTIDATAASAAGIFNAGEGAYTSNGAGWYTAVPEPTSGLLLLLGVAGLALKRRRA